jgi:hypothetical protein
MLTLTLLCGLLFPTATADEVNPALRAAIAASTDVVVVEVLETKPRQAIEGARDTVQLKVVRSLKGAMSPGNKFGVYYHLLWVDAQQMILEKPKFEQGKEYVVFLKSHVQTSGDERKVVYELADQWFAVVPRNESLEKELARLIPKSEIPPGP